MHAHECANKGSQRQTREPGVDSHLRVGDSEGQTLGDSTHTVFASVPRKRCRNVIFVLTRRGGCVASHRPKYNNSWISGTESSSTVIATNYESCCDHMDVNTIIFVFAARVSVGGFCWVSACQWNGWGGVQPDAMSKQQLPSVARSRWSPCAQYVG